MKNYFGAHVQIHLIVISIIVQKHFYRYKYYTDQKNYKKQKN